MIDFIAEIIIVIGGIFSIIGSIGVLRMPDPYNRIHSQTIGVVGGTILILLGVVLLEGARPYGIKVLLIAIIIFVTNPVGSHAIARAAHRSGVEPTDKTVRDDLENDNK